MKKWWTVFLTILLVGSLIGLTEAASIKAELEEYRELDNRIADKYNGEFRPLISKLNNMENLSEGIPTLNSMRKTMNEIYDIQVTYNPETPEIKGVNERSKKNYSAMIKSIDRMITASKADDMDEFNLGIDDMNAQMDEMDKIQSEVTRLARANRLNWVEE